MPSFLRPFWARGQHQNGGTLGKKLYDYQPMHDSESARGVCEEPMFIECMAAIDQEFSAVYIPEIYFFELSDVLGNPGTLAFANEKNDKRITLQSHLKGTAARYDVGTFNAPAIWA